MMKQAFRFNFCIVLIATILLYLPVFKRLFVLWSSHSDYSHGYFILPIALFMVWRKRSSLLQLPITPSTLGLPVILFGLFLYLLGSFGKIVSFEYLSLIIILVGLILYYAGKEIMKDLLFPVLFLFFMFPLPASLYISITAPLQMWISKASVVFIDAIGITVLREGNILYFANTSLEVTEACSGVRSIITFLVTGVFLAYISKSFAARTTLVLSVVPISFLINLLRVTGTGILAHHFGPQIAQGFFHEFTGAVMFVTGVLFMLLEFDLFYRHQRKKQEKLTQ